MWTTQRFNRGVDGSRAGSRQACMRGKPQIWRSRRFSARWEAPGFPWRGASNRALQMRSLALSTVGEFEKERTRLGPKSDFFLAWEIGCVAWEHVKTCKSVWHTAKPWELAALSYKHAATSVTTPNGQLYKTLSNCYQKQTIGESIVFTLKINCCYYQTS